MAEQFEEFDDFKPAKVCVEWDKNNIINVLGIAQALGWSFEIVK